MTPLQNGIFSVSLIGTGTLQPADSYEVAALVTGEILEAPFEEGDVLEEGALLYNIDTSDAENTIERAELSLEKAQMSYNNVLEKVDNLNVKATAAGTVVSLDIEVGDEVWAGQSVGILRDSSVMTLKLPFNVAEAETINIGDSASVSVEGSYETLSGIVAQVGAVDEVMTGGTIVRYVSIEVDNPGAITPEMTATAMAGDIACSSADSFSYKAEIQISALVSGEVTSIQAPEGSRVEEDGVIFTLSSTDVQNSLKESELSLRDSEFSLENQQEALEDYYITSPISGTVITKNYKAGDNLTSSGSARSLCTIYDLSYLTMTLSVDELDISQVEVGQQVTVTAEAVEDRIYQGEVTSVSVQGTTSGGVTTYPVTIRIDETDGLLPGMNVDAEIIVTAAEQVLTVPTSAVQRGNRILVSVDSETGKAAMAEQSVTAEELAEDETLPDDYIYVEVTLGLSDDDYIQVEGLEEGDEIAYPGGLAVGVTESGGDFSFGGMPSGGGFSSGGGMPSGGGGGMPGGM